MDVVLPGSYDPVTLGHIELIKRAVSKFANIHCVVANSSDKSYTFDANERIELIKLSLKDTDILSDRIKVCSFDGLTVDYCVKNNISTIIRGIRGEKDLVWEGVMSYANNLLSCDHNIDTFILLSNSQFTSSSMVKELASLGVKPDRLEKFVTKSVALKLAEKFR